MPQLPVGDGLLLDSNDGSNILLTQTLIHPFLAQMFSECLRIVWVPRNLRLLSSKGDIAKRQRGGEVRAKRGTASKRAVPGHRPRRPLEPSENHKTRVFIRLHGAEYRTRHPTATAMIDSGHVASAACPCPIPHGIDPDISARRRTVANSYAFRRLRRFRPVLFFRGGGVSVPLTSSSRDRSSAGACFVDCW